MFRANVLEKNETFHGQCTFSVSLAIFEIIKWELLRYVWVCMQQSEVVFRTHMKLPNSQQWFSDETRFYRTVGSGFPKRHDCTEQSTVVFRRDTILPNNRQWFSKETGLYRTVDSGFPKRHDCTGQLTVVFRRDRIVPNSRQWLSHNKRSFLAPEFMDLHVKA
jgi:hypothetical protein